MSLSLKNIKYEYQNCMSSTNGSVSIDISIFWGARFKKAPEAVGYWGPISKKFCMSQFFGHRLKSNTQAS